MSISLNGSVSPFILKGDGDGDGDDDDDDDDDEDRDGCDGDGGEIESSIFCGKYYLFFHYGIYSNNVLFGMSLCGTRVNNVYGTIVGKIFFLLIVNCICLNNVLFDNSVSGM